MLLQKAAVPQPGSALLARQFERDAPFLPPLEETPVGRPRSFLRAEPGVSADAPQPRSALLQTTEKRNYFRRSRRY